MSLYLNSASCPQHINRLSEMSEQQYIRLVYLLINLNSPEYLKLTDVMKSKLLCADEDVFSLQNCNSRNPVCLLASGHESNSSV